MWNEDRTIEHEAVQEELFNLLVVLFQYSQDRYGTTTAARILLKAIQEEQIDVETAASDAELAVKLNSEERDQLEEQFGEYLRSQYKSASRRAALDKLGGASY